MTDPQSGSRRDHASLSLDLIDTVRRLYFAADDAAWLDAREEVLRFYETQIGPHLEDEDRLVLKAADDQVETALLAAALRAQHRALAARVDEVRGAETGLDAVAAARAVHALFALHVIQMDEYLHPALRTQTRRSRPAPALPSARHNRR